MSFLPGWASIDSTATIAHNLHVTAVVVLGLLFLAEGMALIYDSRNHHLVGVAQRAADAKAKTDQNALKKQLADANKKVGALEEAQADRHFTDDQKAKLLSLLKDKPKFRLQLVPNSGVSDAFDYATEIADYFQNTLGWVVAVTHNTMIIGPNVKGMWLEVHDQAKIPAAGLLYAALLAAGVPIRMEINTKYGDTSKDFDVWLNIGSKR